MHICCTATRVCAIVGLGFVIGVGHSLIVKSPVGFGRLEAPTAASASGDDPSTGTGTPVVHVPDDGQDGQGGQETDPLDIPGPDGTITMREAMELFDEGAYFIDARHQDEYDEAHIAYALFLPAPKIRTKAGLDELSTIPPGTPIVIYCVGGECDASENTLVAIQKLQMGHTDIRIMGLGFEDWAQAGLPVEHADGTITGEEP